ncbi:MULTISPECIES: vWA domain-containing protein [Vibrio]|uniref:vWA domain-containing protein n=1 Tax=Vibrio TaxID=662 RepID=UPI0014838FB3|nr:MULTISPECIES: VWA domain-containing protein [Vibrio]MDQ2164932.1 VWA domain-containing protein [Vibrio anguillarum]NNN96336.1 VWA domain-containing protein [Vibrio sp. B4-6]
MSEFVFLTPWWLTALFPLALLLGWFTLRAKRHALIAPHLAKAMGLSDKKHNAAIVIISISWLLAVLALAGPSFESQTRPSYSNSNARILVMDMSLSMYATDIKPNRLTQARYKALDLLTQWQEGSTGLVAYAGDAYTVSPLTTDTATLSNLVPNLSPDIMPYPGADAARAVQLAIDMMKNAGLAQGDIVLFADDIDSQEQAQIETQLTNTRWKLVILGIGTQAGAPITLSDGSLLKNAQGQTVVAKTNFANMQSLAQNINGLFTPISLDNSDVAMIAKLDQNEQPHSTTKSQQMVKERVNNGYWLVLLLIIPCLLLFRRGVIFSLLLLFIPSLHSNSVQASPWLNSNQQAKKAFDAKEYQAASEQFTDLEWKGIAQYQAGEYQAAVETLSQLPQDSVRVQYNLANAYAQNGELEKAQTLYEEVLKRDPNHKDAQHNLEIVKKAQQQQQQQQQQQSGEPSDQNRSENKNNAQNKNDAQQQDGEQTGDKSDKQSAGSPQDDGSQSSPQSAQSKDEQSERSKANTADESPASQQPTEATQTNESMNNEDEVSDKEASEQQTQKQSQQQGDSQTVDPQLRKLEQVESARDPSGLLKAQLLLQARQRQEDQAQPPQNNSKKW